MHRVAVRICAVLALVMGGCTAGTITEEIVEQESTQGVTFQTTEYSYEAPASFEGGLTEIVLDNTAGEQAHEAVLILLKEGRTAADYLAAVAAGDPPDYAVPAGGPGPVNPGEKAVYTANLAAGHYMFICNVPAPDGVSHLEKGMVGEADVTEGTDGALPASGATIGMQEFSFIGVDDLRAGSQTVRVVNNGQQPHHVVILALAPNATIEQALAAASGQKPPGPPPFTGFPGLMGTLAPGGEATRTLELEAGGHYLFACFIPDGNGTPHFAKGMQAELRL